MPDLIGALAPAMRDGDVGKLRLELLPVHVGDVAKRIPRNGTVAVLEPPRPESGILVRGDLPVLDRISSRIVIGLPNADVPMAETVEQVRRKYAVMHGLVSELR